MSGLRVPSCLRWVLSAILLGGTAPLYAQNEPDIPAMVPICSGCHGEKGVSALPAIPALAGQNEAYLLKRLMELKTQPTPSETMRGVTHAISEEDLRLLASYFARQPYVRNGQVADKARSARGRDVYNRVCSACHKDEGRATVFAEYPLLAGQSLDYMLNELDHILSRKREVELIKMGSLTTVPRDKIEDAIHFFADRQVSPEQVKTLLSEPPRGSRRRSRQQAPETGR